MSRQIAININCDKGCTDITLIKYYEIGNPRLIDIKCKHYYLKIVKSEINHFQWQHEVKEYIENKWKQTLEGVIDAEFSVIETKQVPHVKTRN